MTRGDDGDNILYHSPRAPVIIKTLIKGKMKGDFRNNDVEVLDQSQIKANLSNCVPNRKAAAAPVAVILGCSFPFLSLAGSQELCLAFSPYKSRPDHLNAER